jgi:hypothetical protein
MSKQTLFHGSYKEIILPEIRIGRHTKDFGNGFYCTVIREQAVRWAKRFDTPVVNTYTALINTNLKVLDCLAAG